ncbi:MAG TPA: cytochrome c maturation protein CcmE [Gallionellaceae bacterium]
MTPRQKKMTLFISIAVVAAGLVAWLVVSALNKDGGINFSYTPSDVYGNKAPQGKSFRVGGLVVEHSMKREGDGLTVRFELTDTVRSMPVLYKGILPDLFKEGKGAVAQGKLEADGIFHADEVLAKHDENYMPPEAKQAIEQAQAGSAVTAAPAKK